MFGKIQIVSVTEEKNEIKVKWYSSSFVEEYFTKNSIDSPIIEFPLSGGSKTPNLKFQFGIERDDSANAKVLYRSLSPLFLEFVQLESIRYDSGYEECYEEEPNIIKNNLTFEANLWYFFLRFPVDMEYGNMSLHFKFKLPKDQPLLPLTKNSQLLIPASQLCNDMEKLFLESLYTDVVMKSVDNDGFRVHKAVLAGRSAVLRAHFDHNTTESITNIVESPFDSVVLREVISFIYKDKASKVDEMPEELLAGADYYQLNRLKVICEQAISKKLTIENAIETLILADRHSAEKLKSFTLEFIKKDIQGPKLTTKTKGWAKLQSVELLKSICE